MFEMISAVFSHFMPAALLLSLRGALLPPPAALHFRWGVLMPVFLGACLGHLTAADMILTLTAYGLALVAVKVVIHGLFWPQRLLPLSWCAALLYFVAALLWGQSLVFATASQASWLNSVFLNQLGGIVLGFAALLALDLSLRPLLARVSKITRLVFAVLVGLILVPWLAHIALVLIKLGWLDVSGALLSWVAKAIGYQGLLVYVGLAVAACALFLFALCEVRPAFYASKHSTGAVDSPQTRKLVAKALQTQSAWKRAGVAFLLVLGLQLYWDQIGSKPPTRSAATPVTLAADGAVHVPITETLTDGQLHRFSWIADDGKVVRFFVINRLETSVKLAVVLDACTMCQDQGYVQKGNQVVCLACQVHIFKPSIGQAGGCNPIPLAWQQVGSELVIQKADLQAGRLFFAQTVPLTVVDPVSKASLLTTEASHQSEYQGQIYFFTQLENYQAFEANPAQYVEMKP